MATINTGLKEYHFYGKDMVEGVYYRKADVDELIESLKAVHNIELPDPPKPRRATNRELARWLAQGNGELTRGSEDRYGQGPYTKTYLYYSTDEQDNPVPSECRVRKWSDNEWHEPDVFYMEIEKEST